MCVNFYCSDSNTPENLYAFSGVLIKCLTGTAVCGGLYALITFLPQPFWLFSFS